MTDVLIVGGGPAGLTMSLLLDQDGVLRSQATGVRNDTELVALDVAPDQVTAALVRPDGFVAWRSPGRYHSDDLHKGLSAITG